jgi:hypothetical protein
MRLGLIDRASPYLRTPAPTQGRILYRYWVTLANRRISTAANQHAAIEELLETAIPTVVRAEGL